MITRKHSRPLVAGAAALATVAILTAGGCRSEQDVQVSDRGTYDVLTLQKGNYGGCEADIKSVRLHGQDAATGRINAAIQSMQAPPCGSGFEQTQSNTEITFSSDQIVSLATTQLVQRKGTFVSGCGDHNPAETFDRTTGQRMSLGTVVQEKDLAAVYRAMAAEITSVHNNLFPDDPAEAAQVTERITAGGANIGVYVQQGKLMARVNQQLFACEEGNYFDAQVPSEYVQNQHLRAAINHTP